MNAIITLSFDDLAAAAAFLKFTDRSKHSPAGPGKLDTALAASAVKSADVVFRGRDGNIISSMPKLAA
jgi:hypothetical protein